jgi:DNA-binding winged helix-turn-helix (wHTH) protein/tetratricopeptide (TPR) repeat protein
LASGVLQCSRYCADIFLKRGAYCAPEDVHFKCKPHGHFDMTPPIRSRMFLAIGQRQEGRHASMAADDLFKIGGATLDLKRGTLSLDGELVQVRSKTFNLISYLVRNAGRVVTKDEIFETVWPGVIVTDDSLTQCVRDARKAIGDQQQEILRTVSRRGYILVEQSAHAGGPERPPTPDVTAAVVRRSSEPVVAVLPFSVNLANEIASVPAHSFNDELADAISRYRSVATIAAASVRKFAAGDDVVQAGIALNADYCISGAITGGDDIELRVDLIEVLSGRRIFGDLVTSASSRLLEAPALLATRIVGRLVGSVEADAARRAQRTATASLQSYAHMIRGIALIRQHGDGFNEAGKAELQKAAEIDPDSGLIQAYLALVEAMIARYRPTEIAALRAARERAVQATALAPDEARCYRILAIILSYLREFPAAQAQYERAMQLNPYDADTLAQLGFMRAMRGDPDEALELMARAVQLNPFHPDWYHSDRSSPLYMLGRFEEAAVALERLPHLTAWQSARVAASYAMAGHEEKAARHLSDAFEKDPELDINAVSERMEWELPQHRDMLAEGLRRAAAMHAARHGQASKTSR